MVLSLRNVWRKLVGADRSCCGIDDYIDQILSAIGGEETEFYMSVISDSVLLSCRYQDCKWGQRVGEMELWEFALDARNHWESEHAAS